MPNHIHLIITIQENEYVNISFFVSTLKRFVNKECGRNIWQRSYYDHIIRNEKDYIKIAKYIEENPKKWLLDKYYIN